MRMRKLPRLSLAALSVAALTGISSAALAQSGELRDDNPNNWPMYNRTFENTRHSPLKDITKENVKNLHVAWIHQPGVVTQGLLETPLVVDGVMYSIASMDRVF